MAGARHVLRQTVHTFFQNYSSLTSIAAVAVLPTSMSLLLSHALILSYPSLLHTIQSRLRFLFIAANFPVQTQFFALLNSKLAQTIFSFVLALPATLMVLVIAKARIIRIICQLQKNSTLAVLGTLIFNSFAILSANAAVFSLFFIIFNTADVLKILPNGIFFLSTAGVIIYSIVVAYTIVICNLAVVVSGVEGRGGYMPIIKAFLLVKSRASVALSLALPANLGMAAIEALFQFRVLRPYRMSNELRPSLICEALLLAYIHSLLVVLDVVGSCVFFKSCKTKTTRHDKLELNECENLLL